VSKLVGPDAANWLSTHWIPNVFFFIIFIVFAASFFGAFELVLPASWVNAIDKRADKGGIAGPVFMALTIALVSFSCTGPIVGTVLVESAKGGLSTPIIAMLGFSLAFALPFGLLVIFPSYMKSLPKSGGWLNSVKVVLGFIELAFALKFLSTADQTYHWGILDREIYLALWIVIFALMAIYLMGKIKFSHDSDIPYWSVTRLMLVIATWSFVVYLVPGLWGAPLKSLAGYLPPMHTQDFRMGSESASVEVAAETCQTPKYSGELHIPHGIQGYFDYEEALACAKSLKKPVFIDFTGHGCVNCRKMEEKVWSNPEVLKILKNDYVVVSLYVDDKKIKLSQQEQFTGKFSGKVIKTLGDKNAEIQACYFNSNSQPLYILMTGNEVLLQHPGSAESFNYNPEKFKVFLQNGLSEFKKTQP
jgi:thiol:disulfide interchange protein DsbD